MHSFTLPSSNLGICVPECLGDGQARVVQELVCAEDALVQLVAQEVASTVPIVAVVHAEVCYTLPAAEGLPQRPGPPTGSDKKCPCREQDHKQAAKK